MTTLSAGLFYNPPSPVPAFVWEPGLHHQRGASIKGFIDCDRAPSAVTRVILAAVMTSSKGGRRQEGGGIVQRELGLRSSPHLALNLSHAPWAGGGRGWLWKRTPLWSPVFGMDHVCRWLQTWSIPVQSISWMDWTDRERQRDVSLSESLLFPLKYLWFLNRSSVI